MKNLPPYPPGVALGGLMQTRPPSELALQNKNRHPSSSFGPWIIKFSAKPTKFRKKIVEEIEQAN